MVLVQLCDQVVRTNLASAIETWLAGWLTPANLFFHSASSLLFVKAHLPRCRKRPNFFCGSFLCLQNDFMVRCFGRSVTTCSRASSSAKGKQAALCATQRRIFGNPSWIGLLRSHTHAGVSVPRHGAIRYNSLVPLRLETDAYKPTRSCPAAIELACACSGHLVLAVPATGSPSPPCGFAACLEIAGRSFGCNERVRRYWQDGSRAAQSIGAGYKFQTLTVMSHTAASCLRHELEPCARERSLRCLPACPWKTSGCSLDEYRMGRTTSPPAR